MITLYGIQSPNVARVRAALIFKELEFQHVSVNLRQRSQEFIDLSISGTIPTLQDGAVIIPESTYSTLYLDDKYPDTYNMTGSNWDEKSKILGLVWAVDNISRPLAPLYMEKFGMLDKMREMGKSHWSNSYDAIQKKDLQTEITLKLARIAKDKQGKYFLGRFTYADACLLALLKTLQFNDMQIGEDWQSYYNDLMSDEKIMSMFPAQDEKGVKEI